LFASKIKTVPQLKKIICRLRKAGKSIVFTNGCFDLLHYGHVSYLEEAKAKGDILVVALNSDASVKRLKGNTRPVVCQKFRAAVIAALGSVDFVVIFDEDTPYSVISSLQPDVLVKGGDWKAKDIVGSDLVLARGGKVMSIRYVPGFSTTNLIKKIAKAGLS